MRRLVYYSLTFPQHPDRSDLVWQLETSIRSLRATTSRFPSSFSCTATRRPLACYPLLQARQPLRPIHRVLDGPGLARATPPARVAAPAVGTVVEGRLLLTAECGVPIVASGNRGSYSYYARPGDFLDLHLDVETSP
jgi:hypothetical protein